MNRSILLSALIGAVVATVVAGSLAWAAIPGPSGVIQGCYDGGGNVKVVEALPCPPRYTAFHWNQQGPQGAHGAPGTDGADGVSVISTALAPGDANCAQGGSRFTAVNGDTYACNGAPGQNGAAGEQGQDGVSGYEIVTSLTISFPPGTAAFRTVTCPLGKRALSGGWTTTSPVGVGIGSLPTPTLGGRAWSVGIHNTSTTETIDTTAFAVCAVVG